MTQTPSKVAQLVVVSSALQELQGRLRESIIAEVNKAKDCWSMTRPVLF